MAITLALGQPADIYLIDEPSAYLDSEQRIMAAKVRLGGKGGKGGVWGRRAVAFVFCPGEKGRAGYLDSGQRIMAAKEELAVHERRFVVTCSGGAWADAGLPEGARRGPEGGWGPADVLTPLPQHLWAHAAPPRVIHTPCQTHLASFPPVSPPPHTHTHAPPPPQVIKRFIMHSKKTAFIVEHDFIMATYMADRVIVYEGEPSKRAFARTPQSLQTGRRARACVCGGGIGGVDTSPSSGRPPPPSRPAMWGRCGPVPLLVLGVAWDAWVRLGCWCCHSHQTQCNRIAAHACSGSTHARTHKLRLLTETSPPVLLHSSTPPLLHSSTPPPLHPSPHPSPPAGMNKFLANLDITFRRDPTNYRPRINKWGSTKDREQKEAGTFYYIGDD